VASALPYRPSAEAIFAPQGPSSALTISFPSAQLTHGSILILVPASGQAVGVIERRVADRTAAGDHVVHLDEHVGVLGVDAGGEVDVGPDVIFERVTDRMAVFGIQAAAVPEVAVVHQERGPAGAEVEESFFGGLEILAGA
jgi:hypothetical protein